MKKLIFKNSIYVNKIFINIGKIFVSSFSAALLFTILNCLVANFINFIFSIDENVFYEDLLNVAEVVLIHLSIYWIFSFILFLFFTKLEMFDIFMEFWFNLFSYVFAMPFILLIFNFVLMTIIILFKNNLSGIAILNETNTPLTFLFALTYCIIAIKNCIIFRSRKDEQ